jgi:HD-GYP domain-containing protein (c-di-GMP phosphodiesterase class II)
MNNSGVLEFFRKRPNIVTATLCIAGLALNLLLNSVVSALNLPLYLDTVGTITVAVLGGYLPGVLVGFFTNIIMAISEPTSLYYGVLNVLIAFFSAFFAERGWVKKIRGMIGMVILFTVICGGLGALIPWFMEGLSFDNESLSSIISVTGHVNPVIAHILSKMITDLPDKTIAVILTMLLIRLIPQKYHRYFGFNMWMQNPIAADDDDNKVHKKTDVRRVSLRIKTLVVFVFSLSTVAVVCTVLSVNSYRKATINEHSQIALGTAGLAAGSINGDRVEVYLEDGGNTRDYKEIKNRLKMILESSVEIEYLYVYKAEPEGFRVVFDIDTEELPGNEVGAFIPYDEGFEPYIPQLLAGEEIEPILTNDKYGHLLTAMSPVYSSDGKCVCYAIADVDMQRLDAATRSFLVEIISVFFGFFILMCTFTIWLTNYHIILPVNSIVKCMNRLSNTSGTQESMDENVKMFRSLGIHTGDELENLYLSATGMTKNQAEQVRSIRKLSESTAKMQDGLIITMADLVESRDSDTGAHVQKTAAYVRIIVEGLKKKGYYIEKITPKFISDVVRSAPLHDVGKINIPDEVLNKPGKLTDEEYEIMKTHTTAGKRIMEHAISTVEGDNYLKEARNMAAYHHERWDGKGYPDRIHGEVIPLSARIMAVADVFDALTSPRVYKPAFPLDKALTILEEGKGTQFDPKCVEVFMEALPEVKVILKKYNEETMEYHDSKGKG